MAKKQQLLENELQILANQNDRETNKRIDGVIDSLPVVPPPASNASITNLIDDSDFSWSHDAYTKAAIAPADAGDANNRAYNWFWMERATALLDAGNANSLKGPDYSVPDGSDIPRWNKINGWAELGELGATPYDICCPLPNNFVTPGMRFYLQMIVRLGNAATIPGALSFFWEFFDNTNTPPLPDIIKGSAFTLDAATFGTLGATTRVYKLLVQTDAGDEVESAIETVTNAPASLSPTNGVALSWPRYPGFTNVEIYVTVGGNSFLVGIVGDGAGAFNDVGQTLRPVDTVPAVSGTVPRAYAETRAGLFVPTLDWVLYEFIIAVPNTYNFGLTTGKQWLRGGVIGLMGDSNQLQIDRIGVSTGIGKWSISEGDRKALSLPSTTQTGSTQGPAGGSTGGGDGEGGPACAVLCTPYLVVDLDGSNERYVDLGELITAFLDDDGEVHVKGMNGQPNRVTAARTEYADVTVDIRCANGHGRRCSLSDRWITSPEDVDGTPASELNRGDMVLTEDGPSQIVRHCALPGATVGKLSTTGDHIMNGGGALQHNLKDLE